MTVRLALLRHGHTAWNRAGRIQGRTDIPLDEDARHELSGYRLPEPWDKADLWSSPLSRAVETAELVAGRTAQTTPLLTEMNWGDWEGQRGIDLRANANNEFRDIEDWGWDYAPPAGEPVRAVRDRVLPWMNGLTRDTVAVCHIGIMRVCLALAHGWDFHGPCPFAVKRNRLYILHRDTDGWRADAAPLRLTEHAG